MIARRDPKPLVVKHKLCVGGYLSQMVLSDDRIADLNPTPAPVVTVEKPAK